jgi:oligopeptide transport system substrate-binding protein
MNVKSPKPSRLIGLLLVAALLVLAASACSLGDESSDDTANTTSTTAEGDGAQEGSSVPGTLRIAQAEAPDAFDPATLGDNRSIELAQNVFDGLTAVDEESLEAVPSLAESWEVSDDGKTYTFTLREATFHDGTPVTAQHFVDALNRTLSPEIGSGYVFFLSAIEGASEVNEGEAETASGIRAVDERTLEIRLNNPAAYFPALAGMWPYWVTDAETIAEHGDDWTTPPNVNGTGAFELTDVQADTQYTFERNEDYVHGAPELERVVVSIVPDPAAQLARYKAGEFDVIYNLTAATYREVQADEELREQFHSTPILRNVWINMRNDVPPFDDKNVRLAFNHAIDKEALIEVALGGLGSPAHTFLPPGLPGSVAEDRDPIEFDPELARELLADAGYEDGEGFPSLDLHYPSGAEFQTVFEFVQGQLQENLGITIGLRPMPRTAYNELLNDAERRPILSQFGFGLDYPDPQEQHEYLGVSQPAGFANYANYSNPEFDRLIQEANATTDTEERYEIHRRAETIYLDDAPIVPLYHPLGTWLAKPYVQGFERTPLYQVRWHGVTVE